MLYHPEGLRRQAMLTMPSEVAWANYRHHSLGMPSEIAWTNHLYHDLGMPSKMAWVTYRHRGLSCLVTLPLERGLRLRQQPPRLQTNTSSQVPTGRRPLPGSRPCWRRSPSPNSRSS